MGGKNSPESINRYMAKAYDRINILVPKGRKDTIKAHAEGRGESMSGFINRAIDQTMAQEAVVSSSRPVISKMALDITDGGNDVLGPSDGRREGNADED